LLDRYIYSFEVGPLGQHSGVSLISDGFTQQSPPKANDIDLFHREGLNVAYSDGHVTYVPDRHEQIRRLPATWGAGILDMRAIAEDVWDAFDGDIGIQAYAFVKGLK